jgi:hypothetical protein
MISAVQGGGQVNKCFCCGGVVVNGELVEAVGVMVSGDDAMIDVVYGCVLLTCCLRWNGTQAFILLD